MTGVMPGLEEFRKILRDKGTIGLNGSMGSSSVVIDLLKKNLSAEAVMAEL